MDAKKLQTKARRTFANRLKAKDPIICKKISIAVRKAYKKNPELKILAGENLKKTNKKLFSNLEYMKELKIKRQLQARDPEYKKRLAEGIAKRERDPEYIKNRIEAIEKRSQSSEWRKNLKKAIQKKRKDPDVEKMYFRMNAYPIKTPDGIFNGLPDAHKFYNKKRNFNNGRKWIKGMMEKKPEHYYKISWEEYDRLTSNQTTCTHKQSLI